MNPTQVSDQFRTPPPDVSPVGGLLTRIDNRTATAAIAGLGYVRL